MDMIILFIIGAVIISAILIYNGLVNKKNQVENAFGGIDVQLKKRYDLLPNLINTVKTYMTHEADTLKEITELRSQATSGTLSNDEKIEIENKISSKVNGIMVAVENYPNLKASDNFIQLQKSLNEIESQLSASRRAYNASVTSYNNGVEMFPSNIFAGMMNYSRKKVFDIPENERENIDVSQIFKN